MTSAEKIMIQGFKVGGIDLPAANGSAYGKGVYTAIGPNAPMSYSGKDRVVILAQALKGDNNTQVPDSWQPRDDWKVFRSGSQLLPKYIVSYF